MQRKLDLRGSSEIQCGLTVSLRTSRSFRSGGFLYSQNPGFVNRGLLPGVAMHCDHDSMLALNAFVLIDCYHQVSLDDSFPITQRRLMIYHYPGLVAIAQKTCKTGYALARENRIDRARIDDRDAGYALVA